MRKEFALSGLILGTPTPVAFSADAVSEINHVLNQCVTGKLCLFQKIFRSDQSVRIPTGSEGDWLREAFRRGVTDLRLQLQFSSIKYVQGSEQGLEYELKPMWVAEDGFGVPVAASDNTFFVKQSHDNNYTMTDCDSTSRCDTDSSRAGLKFFTTAEGAAKVVFTSDLYRGMGPLSATNGSSFFKTGTIFTFEK